MAIGERSGKVSRKKTFKLFQGKVHVDRNMYLSHASQGFTVQADWKLSY